MNYIALLAFAFIGTAHAASFDCKKASTFVEKAICSNKTLGALDEVLSENYRYMLASDIGDGARKHLRESQRAWIKERNRCTTTYCVEALYRERVNSVCETPVLSGVYPICTTSDEIEREAAKVEGSAASDPPSEATPEPELVGVTPEPVSCESFSFLKRSAPFTHDAFAKIVGGLETFAAQHNHPSLTPQQEVPAMREAFKMQGWSLPSTLSKLAEGDISPFADGGLRFSMAALLLAPSGDLSQRELSTLYCDRELEDLATLKQKMSRYE